jgi:hypothetical protein
MKMKSGFRKVEMALPVFRSYKLNIITFILLISGPKRTLGYDHSAVFASSHCHLIEFSNVFYTLITRFVGANFEDNLF